MTTSQILLNVLGLALIGWIVWYFWLWKRPAAQAAAITGDIQEVDITVKGGYQPAAVIVSVGKRVRLNFTRREASTCGEEVFLPAFGQHAHLPQDHTVAVEILPKEPGEFEFTCAMNMYRGKIIVNDDGKKTIS